MEALVAAVLVILILLALVPLIKKESNMRKFNLAPIGWYKMPNSGKLVDLGEYFIDKYGTLYSANPDTWEINPVKKRNLLICSDSAVDKSGKIVNSLRAASRRKVTVRRDSLKFNELAQRNGIITVVGEFVSDRHIKVIAKTKVGA